MVESPARRAFGRDPKGRRIVAWSLAWAIILLVATWLFESDSPPGEALAWTLAAASVLAAVMALAAYRRFLATADEMIQKIQLQALAFGFGAGLLFSLSAKLFEHAGAPDLSTSDVGTVMLVSYIVGVVVGYRRHA